MADLTDLQAAQTVKIAGADNTGAETNYMNVDSSGRPTVIAQISTAAGSAINFGQATMAASLPVVIASNQSAIAIANFPTTVDTNYGAVGASTLRVASQIGNATGSAAFNAGTTTAQTLRVVLPTDQSAIPVSQSGAWTVAATQSGAWSTGRTWTLASGTDSVAAAQSGTWTVQPGNTANTTPWLVTDSSDGSVAAGTAAAKSSLSGLIFNTALPTLTNGQQAALQGDSSARLIIAPLTNASIVKSQLQDNAGAAITLGQKVMASSVPVVIASDQSTLPVSAASLPLPAGAATEATLAKLPVAQGSTTSGQSGPLVQGAVTTASPTYTTGQTSAFSLTLAGALRIDGSAVTQPISAASLPLPAGASTETTLVALNTKFNSDFGASTGAIRVAALLGNATGAALFGAGTTTAQVLRVVLPTDQTSIPVTMLDVSPTNGSITAFDSVTTSLVGANGQVFYAGTPTTNSAAVFNVGSIENVTVQANILGGGGTLVVEVSMDGGTFWLRPNVYQISTQNYTNGFTAPFIATVNVMGMTQVRVRAITSWAGTGTIIVKESTNSRGFTLADSLPTGANVIGGVTQSGTWTTGRTWALTAADIVTAAQGAAAALGSAWPIKLTDGTNTMPTMDVAARAGFHKLTDGTNTAAVKAATTAAAAADPSLVVALSPNSPIPAGSAIIGALVANQSVNLAQILGTATATAGIAGLLAVGGNAASGSSDGGNPVKVGGVFNTALPTLTNGQRGDMQLDAKGRHIVLDITNLGTGTQSALTVTNSAIEIKVGASRLANRSLITATNLGTQTIYWGYTSGVTTASGTPLVQNATGSWKVGDNQSVFLIATSGSQNVRITEA